MDAGHSVQYLALSLSDVGGRERLLLSAFRTLSSGGPPLKNPRSPADEGSSRSRTANTGDRVASGSRSPKHRCIIKAPAIGSAAGRNLPLDRGADPDDGGQAVRFFDQMPGYRFREGAGTPACLVDRLDLLGLQRLGFHRAGDREKEALDVVPPA